MKKIYLAGPDVFRPRPEEHFAWLKEQCRSFRFEGVSPLDSVISEPESSVATAMRIRTANLGLIRYCDAVLANVSPFRGPHADDGTAFEMGYATALGKPVFSYSDDLNPLHIKVPAVDGVDSNGMTVENFSLPVNLMLLDPITGPVHTTAWAALQTARTFFSKLELLEKAFSQEAA